MATDAVWSAVFDRCRRQRLLVSMTRDFLQFSVLITTLPAPSTEDESWFSSTQKSAYRLCVVAWLLAILTEHAILFCNQRPDTTLDVVLLLTTIVVGALGMATSVPLIAYPFYKAGPAVSIAVTFERATQLCESFLDWSFAAFLEVIPCELTVVLRNDLPDGPMEAIDLFIWYKIDLCLWIVDDDADRPVTPFRPYRFPPHTPMADRSNHSPWLTTKVNEILIVEFQLD